MASNSTRSALLSLLGRSPLSCDAVQTRVACLHPRTHSEELEDRRDSRSGTHPGDILYWAAWLGGACLLLLFATR